MYDMILRVIGTDKSMKMIGGDFNAELGPGMGVGQASVGHYTLKKANCRGEWMRSGHRCVRARFVISVKTKQKHMHSEVTSRRIDDRTRNEAQEEKAMKNAAAHVFQKQYQHLEKKITEVKMKKTDGKRKTKHDEAAASTEAAADEAAQRRTKEEKEKEETLALISERRSIKKRRKSAFVK